MQQGNFQIDRVWTTLLIQLLQKEISEEKARELAIALSRTINIVCLLHLELVCQQIEELQKDNQYLREVLENLSRAAIRDRMMIESQPISS